MTLTGVENNLKNMPTQKGGQWTVLLTIPAMLFA